jgi:hypothetical protein
MRTRDEYLRRMRTGVAAVGVAVAGLTAAGCSPSDVLSVPPPIGEIGSTSLNSQQGAESELAGATAQLFVAIASDGSIVEASEVLSDEFTMNTNSSYGATSANIDARYTALVSSAYHIPTGYNELGDAGLSSLMTARSTLLVALVGLQKYEPASGQSKIGEAYALVGYAELFMAEDYCAGVALNTVVAGGGYQYGMPLSTDSLYGLAEAHFTTALTYAAGNDSVINLASVGLGRTRLDRGNFAGAATAVATVPTSFVYNTVMQVNGYPTGQYVLNLYDDQLADGTQCGYLIVSDHEGGNGLNFASAGDPRLVLSSAVEPLCGGGTWYYPIKFGSPSQYVPLATGVEARLMQAEAALQGGQVGAWAGDLTALRGDAASTGVTFPSGEETIDADSTTGASDAAQLAFMFRERAFWLFGTGTRLSDMRRLIRQYGQTANTVFPTGAYAMGNGSELPGPLPTYGPDVSLTLPTPLGEATTSNPNYKGCLSPPSTA